MKSPVTISKKSYPHQSMDYDFLKAEGIKWIQTLASDTWTDYNEHDPGITILENLCYTITELGYKTNYSIEEILTADLGSNEPIPSNAFFKPENILPSQPISKKDYRKLIIDNFSEVKNAWVTKYQKGFPSIIGLYEVKVELAENTIDHTDEKKAASAKEKIRNKITQFLSKHRNLCEDFGKVTILEADNLEIKARIDISSSAVGEIVLSQILFEIENILAPRVRLYTAQELIEEGYGLNEILNGPYTEKGFIKEEDLKPLITQISIPKLTKTITNIEGVYNVWDFKVYQQGVQVKDDMIPIAADQYSFIKLDWEEFTDSNFPIKLYKNRIPVKIDFHKTQQLLHNLSFKRTSFQTLNIEEKDIQQFSSRKILGDYYSMQHHLPEVYGLNKFGLSDTVSDLRKAQAKQLKAYLLFFDQVLADHLAQLVNVRNLFSIDPAVRQTYFTQIPKDVPELETILNNEVEAFGSEVNELIKEHENFEERRNRFVDHLIARFGESRLAELITSLWQNNSILGIENADNILNTKLEFIKAYEALSKGRNISTCSENGVLKRSTLVEKLRILFNVKQDQNLATAFRTAQFQFGSGDAEEAKEAIIRDLLLHGRKEDHFYIEAAKESYDALYRSPELAVDLKICAAATETTCEKKIAQLITFLKQIDKASRGFYMVEHILLRPSEQAHYGFRLWNDAEEAILVNAKYGDLETLQLLSKDISMVGTQRKNYRLRLTDTKKYVIELLDNYGECIALVPGEFSSSTNFDKKINKTIEYISQLKKRDTLIEEHIDFFIKKEATVIEEDYSHRLSFVFPNWCSLFNQIQYQNLIREIIMECIPIHLRVELYFVGIEDMEAFEKDYLIWESYKWIGKKKVETIITPPKKEDIIEDTPKQEEEKEATKEVQEEEQFNLGKKDFLNKKGKGFSAIRRGKNNQKRKRYKPTNIQETTSESEKLEETEKNVENKLVKEEKSEEPPKVITTNIKEVIVTEQEVDNYAKKVMEHLKKFEENAPN